MIETLKTLCALSGPSGCEDAVRDYIKKEAEPYADKIEVLANGSLVVFKHGRSSLRQKILLCAHMDEVGLIVTRIEDNGCLRFQFVGGVDRRVVIGKKVFVGDARIPGVIGMKPIHLTTDEEEESIPRRKDLYIDIGARSKAEAESLTFLGDYVNFDNSITELQNGFIRMKAIDDRVGCAVLLEVLKQELPVDTWFAFTVQEEIGGRGAHASSFHIQPDIALVVEGTTAADMPMAQGAERVCCAGKGPVLPFMDKATIYDRELFRLLRSIAEEQGIPWQTKTRIAGGTDAQAIQRACGGCKVGAVAAAVRYIHSPSSVGNTRDFEQIQAIVTGFLEKMEEKYAESAQ